jgi:hypothetical protein
MPCAAPSRRIVTGHEHGRQTAHVTKPATLVKGRDQPFGTKAARSASQAAEGPFRIRRLSLQNCGSPRAFTRFHGRCLMKPVTQSASFTLILDAEERTELLRFLEQALSDTHVEARRTEDPDYRDQVHHREDLLRGLIGKLRQT